MYETTNNYQNNQSSYSINSTYFTNSPKPICCGRRSGGAHRQCPSCPFR